VPCGAILLCPGPGPRRCSPFIKTMSIMECLSSRCECVIDRPLPGNKKCNACQFQPVPAVQSWPYRDSRGRLPLASGRTCRTSGRGSSPAALPLAGCQRRRRAPWGHESCRKTWSMCAARRCQLDSRPVGCPLSAAGDSHAGSQNLGSRTPDRDEGGAGASGSGPPEVQALDDAALIDRIARGHDESVIS
jgi:hypothetical protein